MFPVLDEMTLIHQLMVIETKFNMNNEQDDAPHQYWIGLKFDNNQLSQKHGHDSEL